MEMIKRLKKKNCKKCPYKDNWYGNPALPEQPLTTNTLYGDSNIKTKMCGYQTILHHVWNFLVMSDKKFVSTLTVLEEGIKSPVAKIIQHSDVIGLDEISSLLESPSMDIEFETQDSNGITTHFFSTLKNEVHTLAGFIHAQLPPLQRNPTSASMERSPF